MSSCVLWLKGGGGGTYHLMKAPFARAALGLRALHHTRPCLLLRVERPQVVQRSFFHLFVEVDGWVGG